MNRNFTSSIVTGAGTALGFYVMQELLSGGNFAGLKRTFRRVADRTETPSRKEPGHRGFFNTSIHAN